MLGDALWYPLWDASNIISTIKEIARIIGDNGKISSNSKVVTTEQQSTPVKPVVVNTDPISPITFTSPQGKDHQSAHKILLDSIKDGNEESAKLVNDFGIESPDDLLLLEEVDIRLLAESLKIVPRKKFLNHLNYI